MKLGLKRRGVLARTAAACAAGGLVLVLSSSAAADEASQKAPLTTTTSDYRDTQSVDGSQVVTFRGDPLVGDKNGAYGDVIRRPPGVIRVALIRPRMNFVPELLKSVENL